MSALVDRGARILDPYAFEPLQPSGDHRIYPRDEDERRGRQAVAREQARKIIASMRDLPPELAEAARVRCHGVILGDGSDTVCAMFLGHAGAVSWDRVIDAALSDADASGREE